MNHMKKLLAIGVTLIFMSALLNLLSFAVAKRLRSGTYYGKNLRPYASTVDTDNHEEAETECSPDICGGEPLSGHEPAPATPKQKLKETMSPPENTESTAKEEKKVEIKKEETKKEDKNVEKKTVEKTPTEKVEKKVVEKKLSEEKKNLEATKKKQEEGEKKRKAAEELKKAEETKKLQEEKRKAEELGKQKRYEEEKKILEAQAKQKALEEERKQLEAGERQKALEELARKTQEEQTKAAEIQRAIQEIQTKAGQPSLPVEPVSTTYTPTVTACSDINNNSVCDDLEKTLGRDPTKVDEDLVKVKMQLVLEEKKLIEGGKAPEEAKTFVEQEEKKIIAMKNVETIREVAQKKFGRSIVSNTQGVQEHGISDEVRVLLGENPNLDTQLAAEEKDKFTSRAEKKLYGLDPQKNVASLAREKRIAVNLTSGMNLSTQGFTVLGICPMPNQMLNLYALDRNGRQMKIDSSECSENNKVIFATGNLRPGQYLLQVRSLPRMASYPLASLFYKSVNAAEGKSEQSAPALVTVMPQDILAQPRLQLIKSGNEVNLEESGIQNIQLLRSPDGKVIIRGKADIGTAVIGTFKSAVFTSALLADVEAGRFEVVSPRPLNLGKHEIVIYATKPQESSQSAPVKLRFNIIETAKAAAPEQPIAPSTIKEVKQPALAPKKSPLPMVLAFVGLAVLFGAIGMYWKQRKE